LYNDEEQIFFGYYQKIKKSTKRKRLLRIEGTRFHSINDGIVNLGGNFDFIIHHESIYILNPRYFEFAFKFNEHIENKRDKVLNTITYLSCLVNEDTKNIFVEQAQSHLFARSLAQVSDATLNNLESYYNDRCEDLKEINTRLEEASAEQVK